MITKRIIPCLDIKNGRVVKGVNFLGLADVSSPVKLAEFGLREKVHDVNKRLAEISMRGVKEAFVFGDVAPPAAAATIANARARAIALVFIFISLSFLVSSFLRLRRYAASPLDEPRRYEVVVVVDVEPVVGLVVRRADIGP